MVDGETTHFRRVNEIGGIYLEQLAAMQQGTVPFDILSKLDILPTEIEGVANDPNMDTAKLTALIMQLQFELKMVCSRMTQLESIVQCMERDNDESV